MQEVTTFEEILKMQPDKFASEDDENRGRILYALTQEIFKLRTELEELKSSKACEIVEKMVVLKDVSYSEAESMVENYLKTHKKANMYEVSNELGLNLKMVHEIVEQLIKEGKVE
ncbi:FeoC like transcriptional regulator [Candidatus Methanophagaceae archaeon]|nr:FeoC like transcriptional regulator [Methanophagales archaeon]